MDRAQRVTRELVPQIVSLGAFGNKDVAITECRVKPQKLGDDHFTSDTFFLTLELADGNTHDLLVKLAHLDPALRQNLDTDVLFHNEVLMYTRVLEELDNFVSTRGGLTLKPLFPKCYHATTDGGDTGVVVLEDLRPKKFRTATERAALDYDHCALALRALGRFHAVSYAMKTLEGSKFHVLTSDFRRQHFIANPTDEMDGYLQMTSFRGLDYLENTQGLAKDVIQRLRVLLDRPAQLLAKMNKPSEPLAVLCHGDFCRNNMLFRYHDEAPSDVVFFDLQTVRYASPVVDMAFFLYLNTSTELRGRHWDTLVQEYHGAMVSHLAQLLQCQPENLPAEYSLENLRREIASRAIYGYVICSFFLPDMMVDPEDQIDFEGMTDRPMSELAELNVKLGGLRATEALAEVLKHVVSLGGV